MKYDIYVDPDCLDGDRLIVETNGCNNPGRIHDFHESISLPRAIAVDGKCAKIILQGFKESVDALLEMTEDI